MTPDLVRRLDSARMSALFTESLANREDGEFLSPRTELTIEDVRRLRLDQDEKRKTSAGSFVSKALRKTPLLKLKKKKKEEEPQRSIPEKSEVRGSFDMDLLMETGDAESWLVSSPSAAGGNKDIDEYFSVRGDHTNRSSYSRPPRSVAAGSDAKSSLIGDPPLSPELKSIPDEGRASPLPSRIPRDAMESPVSDLFDNDTPLTLEPAPEPKRKSFAFSRSPHQATGQEQASKSRLKLPRFGRSIPSPPPSICSDRPTASPNKMSAQLPPIRRASSVISNLSETPDISGVASPRSEIVTLQTHDDEEDGVRVFGRKKRLSFSGSKIMGKIPQLRHKKGDQRRQSLSGLGGQQTFG
ncbi:hypothetical protein BSKO_05140 [Bryopsis sp. KO-2023]|nr:hypothetical protein BSKO_05140 [Bryopsis sp. KO-2023]